MSPELSAAARAAGQRMTDPARVQAPAEWRCTEPDCVASGIERTYASRERALYVHRAIAHPAPKEDS